MSALRNFYLCWIVVNVCWSLFEPHWFVGYIRWMSNYQWWITIYWVLNKFLSDFTLWVIILFITKTSQIAGEVLSLFIHFFDFFMSSYFRVLCVENNAFMLTIIAMLILNSFYNLKFQDKFGFGSCFWFKCNWTIMQLHYLPR